MNDSQEEYNPKNDPLRNTNLYDQCEEGFRHRDYDHVISRDQMVRLIQQNIAEGVKFAPLNAIEKIDSPQYPIPVEMLKSKAKYEIPWDDINVGRGVVIPPGLYKINSLYVAASRRGKALNKKFRVKDYGSQGIFIARVE